MNARRITSVLLILAATASAQSTRPSVGALIDSLQSPDWPTRQSAEDELVAVGAAAIDAINAALKTATDDELRQRLQSVLTRLSQEQLLLPTRVTVQKEFVSPAAAFSYLAEQAGVRLEIPRDQTAKRAHSAGPVRLDLAGVPWLAAVRDLAFRNGFATDVRGTRLRLLDPSPDALDPPTDFAGPLAVIASGVREVEALPFGAVAARRETCLNLVVELEPKARLVESTASLFIHRIVDTAGNIVCQDGEFGLSGQGAHVYGSGLILNLPGKGATGLSLIEGEVRGEFVTRLREIRVADLTTLPHTIELPEGDVVISSVGTSEKGSQIVLLVPKHLNGRPAGLRIDEAGIEGLEVFDQDRKPMRLSQISTERQEGGVEYRYLLIGDSPAARAGSVTWSVPASKREISIPFTLKNLPLPE